MWFDSGMRRRDFLKRAGFSLSALAMSGSRFAWGEQPRAAKIVPGKLPDFVLGKLSMQWADSEMIREAASVHPFDLQARMKFAINAMTTCVDPNRGYISYPLIFFQTRPAHMKLLFGAFADDMGRHTDSLWMIRGATNDRRNDEVVHKFVENCLDGVDRGLVWNPPDGPFGWPQSRNRMVGRWTEPPEVSRVMLGLLTYYRATGDPRALNKVRSMVRGFFEIAEKNQSYIWYPDYNYTEAGNRIVPIRVVDGEKINVSDPSSGAGAWGGNQPGGWGGMMLLPLMRYYEESNDSLAAEMAMMFSRLIIDLLPEFARNVDHTHSNLATISGILETGSVLGIPEFVDWSKQTYDQYILLNELPQFGWLPESTGVRPRVKNRLCCETCAVVDYLEIALQLAESRDENYWDLVERIAMNQLLEAQILRLDFINRIPPSVMQSLPQDDPKWFTTDHVPERSLGGFGIFAGPNDWVQKGDPVNEAAQTNQCCFGSGARGLYDSWYYAAQEDRDKVRVNLQFSKRLPSATITSYMPGKSVVVVEMTAAKKLQVRKPGWAPASQTRMLVNGQEQTVRLEETYFDFGGLPAGTKVRIEFPDQTSHRVELIRESQHSAELQLAPPRESQRKALSSQELQAGVKFTTTWRGNAVTDIEPAGEIYPLYQERNQQEAVVPLAFISTNPINPL
jgi:hypothetical protein